VCVGVLGLGGAGEGTARPWSETRGGFRRGDAAVDDHGAFERMVAWGRLGSSSGGAGYGGALGVDAPAVSADVGVIGYRPRDCRKK